MCTCASVCRIYNKIILLAAGFGVSAHRQGQSLEPRRATRRPPPLILVSIPTMRYVYYIFLFFYYIITIFSFFHYYYIIILIYNTCKSHRRAWVLRDRQMPFRRRVPGIMFLSRPQRAPASTLDGRQCFYSTRAHVLHAVKFSRRISTDRCRRGKNITISVHLRSRQRDSEHTVSGKCGFRAKSHLSACTGWLTKHVHPPFRLTIHSF